MYTVRMLALFPVLSCVVRSTMLLVCCAIFVTSGCSKGPSFETATKQDLTCLGLEMHNVRSSVQSDLEAKSVDAKKLIDSGEYVVLPGFDKNLTSFEKYQFIVAYHKDTPTKGGYALHGDGSVDLFTPEEFQKTQKWDSKPNPSNADSPNTADR